jgi:hypothetical protein
MSSMNVHFFITITSLDDDTDDINDIIHGRNGLRQLD